MASLIGLAPLTGDVKEFHSFVRYSFSHSLWIVAVRVVFAAHQTITTTRANSRTLWVDCFLGTVRQTLVQTDIAWFRCQSSKAALNVPSVPKFAFHFAFTRNSLIC